MRAWAVRIMIGLLVMTNLATGWLLYGARGEIEETNRSEARIAVGALLDAARAIEPVIAPAETEDQDRLLRAHKALQIAFQALYGLEVRNELPTDGPRWSEVTNLLQGPLNGMIITRDYTDLPTVKRRLAKVAELVAITDGEALPKLREGQRALDAALLPEATEPLLTESDVTAYLISMGFTVEVKSQIKSAVTPFGRADSSLVVADGKEISVALFPSPTEAAKGLEQGQRARWPRPTTWILWRNVVVVVAKSDDAAGEELRETLSRVADSSVTR